MKLKQTMLTISILGTIAFGALVFVPSVGALECTVLPDSICGQAENGDLESSGTWELLLAVIRIMTAGIGIVAVGMIAYAAFLYTTAMDNESQTKQAKEMIRNVAIGLAVFILMWAGIEWLIPGGIFR